MRKTTSMKKIRELLRLVYECGLSKRKAATGAGISRTAAQEILARVTLQKLNWPLPLQLSDEDLNNILFL